MTKRLKRAIIGALAAIMLFCAGLLILPGAIRTYADESTDDFAFTPGATVSYYRNERLGLTYVDMKFELKKLNTRFDSLATAPGGWWWGDTTPYLSYTFTVYRKDGEKNVKLYTYCIFLQGDSEDTEFFVRIDKIKHVYDMNEITFYPLEKLASKKTYIEQLPDGTTIDVAEKTATPADLGGKINLPFENDALKLTIRPNNAYSEYFVTLDYELFMWSSNSIGRDEIKTSGHCQSSVRSVYKVFKSLEDAGKLSETYRDVGAYNYAYNIIHGKVEKNVSISYLVQIPGTPFASKKTQTATVTMQEDNDTLPKDEAASALGVKSFDCLESYCGGFVKGENGSYVANYFNNVWLKARTVDGNDYNYYLNINESYAEFYNHFVDAGIFDRGAYETVFSSQIYANYKEQLTGYSPETIYGYFGFAMIPKTYGINTLWKEFFNTKTSQAGLVSTFEYGVDLTLDAYNTLLEDYNYAFLSRVWNDALNLINSGEEDTTCYILYVEPGQKTAFVAENGAEDINDDTGTAIRPVAKVGELIGSIGGAIGDGISGVASWIKGLSGKTKAFSLIIVVALCVAAGVVIIKLKNTKK